MAFLTKYNLSQLCQKLNVNIDVSMEIFLEHIYQDTEIYAMLNKREIEYLFKYKMLLDDEEKFIVEYYQDVPVKEDTKNYVFNKGGKMKYHLSPQCKLISKDYLDFNIPEEIKAIGDDAITEYRDWFNQNNFGDKYRNKTIDKNAILFAFNSKYPSKYNLKPIEDNSNILIIEQSNSKHEAIDTEYSSEKTIIKLEELKIVWNSNFPCRVTRVIAKFKHLLNKSDTEIDNKISELFSPIFIQNYGMQNLKNKFILSKKLTTEIISLLLDHIKWTYNQKEKDFDNSTLEKFGLECCLNCVKEYK